MNRNRSEEEEPDRADERCAQSQTVGAYMPQEDGRKSRCRLVTTITKRSSHMPTLTTIAIANSSGDVCGRAATRGAAA